MKKERCIIAAICLVIFAVLTYLVSTGETLKFDTIIREWFYSIRADELTEFVKAVTFMGNTKTIVVLCIVFLIIPKITKKIGTPIAVTAIIGSLLNKAMKHIMMRPRPDVSLHLIEQGGWSFPSGHSISGLLMYGLLAWLILHYAKRGVFANNETDIGCEFANSGTAYRNLFANIAAVILTLLWIGIGLSRIYLGVHYPTDVLGGWCLGMIIMMVVVTVIEKHDRKRERQ